ncbi:hypothetical protein [Candidatus Magnetominusculus dajiuhuensis]|uniref:hypothetical protein n=1 Tax=Candidatus Magnetominusculus dajiuhuensis TaxID=3137712 RepID=UPI003B4333F2
MNKGKIQVQDVDLAKAEIALWRAAVKAKKIAGKTNTPLVVYEGGCIVKKFSEKQGTPNHRSRKS